MSTSVQLREEIEAKGAEETTCCVVGGGPTGAMLALMLARQGVEVTLLEAHRDFERFPRRHAVRLGDGDPGRDRLAHRLLDLRHAKVRHFTVPTKGAPSPSTFSRG